MADGMLSGARPFLIVGPMRPRTTVVAAIWLVVALIVVTQNGKKPRPAASTMSRFGGGGLAAGIISGLRSAGALTPVWGVEPAMANDVALIAGVIQVSEEAIREGVRALYNLRESQGGTDGRGQYRGTARSRVAFSGMPASAASPAAVTCNPTSTRDSWPVGEEPGDPGLIASKTLAPRYTTLRG
jgi:predicted lipid-binding transport protein (Tim44 family)